MWVPVDGRRKIWVFKCADLSPKRWAGAKDHLVPPESLAVLMVHMKMNQLGYLCHPNPATQEQENRKRTCVCHLRPPVLRNQQGLVQIAPPSLTGKGRVWIKVPSPSCGGTVSGSTARAGLGQRELIWQRFSGSFYPLGITRWKQIRIFEQQHLQNAFHGNSQQVDVGEYQMPKNRGAHVSTKLPPVTSTPSDKLSISRLGLLLQTIQFGPQMA